MPEQEPGVWPDLSAAMEEAMRVGLGHLTVEPAGREDGEVRA